MKHIQPWVLMKLLLVCIIVIAHTNQVLGQDSIPPQNRSEVFAEFMGPGFIGSLGYRYSFGESRLHRLEAGGIYLPISAGNKFSIIYAGWNYKLKKRSTPYFGVGVRYYREHSPGYYQIDGSPLLYDRIEKEIATYAKLGYEIALSKKIYISPSFLYFHPITSYSLNGTPNQQRKTHELYFLTRIWFGLSLSFHI